MRNIFTRRYERLWIRNGRVASFFLGSRWTQTWSYAAPKNYVAGSIQRHRVLTRSTGCRQQASRKFISRKNEKLLDKQHILLGLQDEIIIRSGRCDPLVERKRMLPGRPQGNDQPCNSAFMK